MRAFNSSSSDRSRDLTRALRSSVLSLKRKETSTYKCHSFGESWGETARSVGKSRKSGEAVRGPVVAHRFLHVLEHELLNLVDVLELTDDALEGFRNFHNISGDAPYRSTRIAPDSLWKLVLGRARGRRRPQARREKPTGADKQG